MLVRALQYLLLVLALHLLSAAQSSWENENEAGEKAFREGRYADAAQLFNAALKDAQQFGSNDVRLAPIYNNLALLSFVQNNFTASEVLFEKAIAALQANGEDSPLLLPVLDNLTSLYVKQWAFGKAIQTAWRSCQIREKKFGSASLETASGLNKLGTLYLDSVRLLSESAEIPTEPSTSQPLLSNASADLKDLSAAYANAASLDETTKLQIAEWLFSRVLLVQEKAYGVDSARLVDVLENRAEAQYELGKISSAEEAYARVIAIIEKSFGADDLKLFEPLQQAAELKTEVGKDDEAEKLYGRALQIGEARLGASNPSLAPVMRRYAALLEKMNQPEEAKKLAARADTLAPQKNANLAPTSSATSGPYVLRFLKSVSDYDSGAQRSTCTLIRANGRFRIEEQSLEKLSSASAVHVQRPPDGLPDMNGPLQETFSQASNSGGNSLKVYEGALPGDMVEQLRAILSAKAIRDLRGNYPSGEGSSKHGAEKVEVSILNEDGVQDFVFPDTSARQPYDATLQPLLKWVSTAAKHKGAAIKGATSDRCTPETPAHVLLQFSAAHANPPRATTISAKADASSHDTGLTPTPTIKVQVNLVLARVVVRDKQGHAVETLRQEDFQLKDNGQPRTITKFSLEQGTKTGSQSDSSSDKHLEAAPVTTTNAPVQSVAFLFDDLHMDAADFNLVRAAADRQLTSLPANVQAGIFTTSGQVTQDFTAAGAPLHDALFRIHPIQAASSAESHCPEIDTYLADLIWNQRDEDALASATEDALVCAYGSDPRFARSAENMAKATAERRLASAQTETRAVLGAFQDALRHLAAAPGQHVLVLVSPGFVAPNHEQEFSQLIDHVLQSDIVINTLDLTGLSPAGPVMQSAVVNSPYRQQSTSASQQILTNLANATGGTAFHGSNDFAAGLGRVANPPESYYVLGFSPRNEELDGRFHSLSVSVNSPEKLTLQVRKGFYAKKN